MKPLIIGITGGIGSGKSTIAKIFSVLDIPVYNSDERAKEIYLEPQVRAEVEKVLGTEAYHSDNTLNKKFIAFRIFADKQLLEKINLIIHSAVGKDFTSWVEKNSDKKIVVKEAAILFETGIYKSCHKTILVTAPEEVRIQRVMSRDNISREEVVKRIGNQWGDEDKKKLADFVIDNGGEQLVVPAVIELVDDLKHIGT
jgi:dephospho-CoA kinase